MPSRATTSLPNHHLSQVDLPMELESPVSVGSDFGLEMRKANKRSLKFDAALHPALRTVGSFDRTHQQDMVNLIKTQCHNSIHYLTKKLFFQYYRFSSRLAKVQTTCDKYNLGKDKSSLPPSESFAVWR